MGASTLSVALVVDNVLNGHARPFFGGLSDRIERERRMALASSLGAVSYWLLALAGHTPWAFVLCAGLIFFTWGEILSPFPSTCTDTFGPGHATANVRYLYTAKGTSAFLVPLANLLKSVTGNVGAGVPGCRGHQCGGRAGRAAADAGEPDAARQGRDDASRLGQPEAVNLTRPRPMRRTRLFRQIGLGSQPGFGLVPQHRDRRTHGQHRIGAQAHPSDHHSHRA
jgi:hypothetical protein